MEILRYIFAKTPGPQFKYYIPMAILIILLIGGGIVFSAIYKNRKKTDFAFKKLFQKTGSRLVVFGIIFIVLLLLRYENIVYFSMRIWLYLTFLLLLYFLYRTARAYKVDYPREKMNAQIKRPHIHKENRKYLPNKKKRH